MLHIGTKSAGAIDWGRDRNRELLEMPTCGDYTMRAHPRRRAVEDKEEPVFLRKTFEMIKACDQAISTSDRDENKGDRGNESTARVAVGGGRLACWSLTGETFIVKDSDAFASEVIPRFFKREWRLLLFVVVLIDKLAPAVTAGFDYFPPPPVTEFLAVSVKRQ